MDGRISDFLERISVLLVTNLKLPNSLYRTGLNGDHYLNYLVTTPKPYFISATHTKANVVDSEYVAKELTSIIEQLGPSKVVAIVMDNASTCTAAEDLITKR